MSALSDIPGREPLSRVDTAWLRMEQPTNLMMIAGVIVFEQPMDYARLQETIEQRFLSFRRFRQKAVDGPTGAYWEIDEDFDIHAHIRPIALPGAADRAELEILVAELASTPLDKERPLWQFHLVENYEPGPVLITRIHHCIADGIALIQVFLSLTDDNPQGRSSACEPETWKQRRASESAIFRRLLEPAREGLDFATLIGQKMLQEGQKILRDPAKAGHYALEAGELVSELGNSLMLHDDPKTRFKGQLGVRKQVAWTDPLSLNEVKSVSKAFACTVNDVLISAVTGALRSFLVEEGDAPESLQDIRATASNRVVIMAVCAPSFAATQAASAPACPPPITIMSYLPFNTV